MDRSFIQRDGKGSCKAPCGRAVSPEHYKIHFYLSVSNLSNDLHITQTLTLLKRISPRTDQLSELIYRFEFPEAPGALNKFLQTVNHFNQGWSISLFHYRNHGHDVGRVLMGIIVNEDEREAFNVFLDKLDYKNTDETNNPAYLQFLR